MIRSCVSIHPALSLCESWLRRTSFSLCRLTSSLELVPCLSIWLLLLLLTLSKHAGKERYDIVNSCCLTSTCRISSASCSGTISTILREVLHFPCLVQAAHLVLIISCLLEDVCPVTSVSLDCSTFYRSADACCSWSISSWSLLIDAWRRLTLKLSNSCVWRFRFELELAFVRGSFESLSRVIDILLLLIGTLASLRTAEHRFIDSNILMMLFIIILPSSKISTRCPSLIGWVERRSASLCSFFVFFSIKIKVYHFRITMLYSKLILIFRWHPSQSFSWLISYLNSCLVFSRPTELSELLIISNSIITWSHNARKWTFISM